MTRRAALLLVVALVAVCSERETRALQLPVDAGELLRGYLSKGLWDEAASVVEQSAAPAAAGTAAPLPESGAGPDVTLLGIYIAAQQGRFADARERLARLEAASAGSSPVSQGRLAQARAMWLVESRRWVEVQPPVTALFSAGEIGVDAAFTDLFVVGLAAIRSGNRMAGGNALQQMAILMADSPTSASPATGAQAAAGRPAAEPPAAVGTTAPVAPAPGGKPAAARSSGGSSAAPGRRPPASTRAGISPLVDVTPAAGSAAAPGTGGNARLAQVMAQQLEAVLLFSEGRREEAVVLARQAGIVEETLAQVAGAPSPVKPALELVGEMLLDLRRPKEAMAAFDAALLRYPRRALSLLGLGRASLAARDTARAMAAYGELRKVWKNADKGLPELRELGLVPPSF